MTATRKAPARRPRPRGTLADLFRRRDDDDSPPGSESWPPPERIGYEDPRDRIPVRWLPISGYRDQVVDSKLAAYLQCAANEDTAWVKAINPARESAYQDACDQTREAWRQYMSALLFGYWPEHEGRLALPAPNVPRPAPMGVGEMTGPGDFQVLPTVRVGGVHLTLDPEPLPDLSRPGQSMAETAGPGPGQPDATVSFAVTGETQPIGRPHPDHGKPFTDLEQEMARLDDAEDIQP